MQTTEFEVMQQPFNRPIATNQLTNKQTNKQTKDKQQYEISLKLLAV